MPILCCGGHLLLNKPISITDKEEFYQKTEDSDSSLERTVEEDSLGHMCKNTGPEIILENGHLQMDNISEEGSLNETTSTNIPPSSTSSPRFKRRRPNRGSFKKFRRKSEEFFRRKSPSCVLGSNDGGGAYFKSQTPPGLSTRDLSFNTASDEESPFNARRWNPTGHNGIPNTSSRPSIFNLGGNRIDKVSYGPI